MLLRSTGLRVLGVQWLVRRRDRSAATEALLIVVHTGLYLTAVLWVLSPLKALAFIAVQQAVFSLYLGCSFAPNHKGMPIIAADSEMSFAELQVITARNVTGGRFTSLMLGGLNYQIEHHLFPTMPRPNLARAQSLIRAFCVDSDLGYCEASLVDSYRQAVHALGDPFAVHPAHPRRRGRSLSEIRPPKSPGHRGRAGAAGPGQFAPGGPVPPGPPLVSPAWSSAATR